MAVSRAVVWSPGSTIRWCLPLLNVLTLLNMLTVEASLNLFLKHDEVLRLFGLKSLVYYIQDGKVNDYALKFEHVVKAETSDLFFTWQSQGNFPIPYSIAMTVSDLNALDPPTMNISSKGIVPMKERVFRIHLPCTGKIDAEVEVQIFINITMSPSANVTSLNLKRKKVCLKSETKEVVLSREEKEDQGEASVLADTSTLVTSTSPLYIAVGCASGMILILSLLALMCYVKSQKRQTNSVSYGGSSTHLSSSKQGQAFLKVDVENDVTTLSKVGSHYSSFRRLMTTPNSLYRTLSVPTHIMNNDRVSQLSEQIYEMSVDRRKILLKDKIQEGTFGQIFKGFYFGGQHGGMRPQEVLIKTVSDQASALQVSLVLSEGMMMRSLQHPNILSVIATCTEDPQRPLLLYQMMNQGNLKLFLNKCKFSPEGHVLTLFTQNLVQMALQIAQGLIYLHKKKIIHRDVATRNCVVNVNDDGSFLVKITDNALSRDLFPNDYHCLGDNENRPVKWLALESLLKKEFSQLSDIWSYGVTLWELMTLGQQPYFEVDPFEMVEYLSNDYRLYQPVNCPDKLYEMMICCWHELPDSRPTLQELYSWLQDFNTTLGDFI